MRVTTLLIQGKQNVLIICDRDSLGMRRATIRQLQVFVEAARLLSFARVSERLHLTPAAVSFQIKQLESITGSALFERIGKRVRLTDAGRLLLGYAEMIINALGDADQVLASYKGLRGGRVAVGLVSTAKYLMPHILARFRALHPDVAIRLVDGNRREVLGLLVKGEVELAIMGQPPAGVDVEAQAFAPHPTVIIAAPSHRLVGRKTLRIGDLAGESFISREDGSGTRALLEDFFGSRSFTPRVAITSSSNETIKQAVIAGMGIAGISQHTIGIELGLGLLKVLPVEGLPLMRAWFIAHRRRMPLMPLHAALRNFIVAEGRGIIAELEQSYATILIARREPRGGGRRSKRVRRPSSDHPTRKPSK
jgi:LysR family transcriptional regulator, low CO2-responsive transcriptional regulator